MSDASFRERFLRSVREKGKSSKVEEEERLRRRDLQGPPWEDSPLTPLFALPTLRASSAIVEDDPPIRYPAEMTSDMRRRALGEHLMAFPQVIPATYIVYRDGGITYAFNSTTGKIDYSDSKAATVLQAAMTQVFENEGKLFIRKGDYNTGTTQLSLTGNQSRFSIEFEPGARITYTGTSFAFKMEATTKGSLLLFSIINPQIESPNGSGMQFLKCPFLGDVVNPEIYAKIIGIDVDDINDVYIGRGGWIHKYGTARDSGSIGIRLGNTGHTNNVTIDVHDIGNFEKGIQIGNSSYSTWNQNNAIHVFFIANEYGVYGYCFDGLNISHSYFQLQTDSSIYVDNEGGGSYYPDTLKLSHVYFTESGIYGLYVVDYLIGLWAFDNIKWGTIDVRLTTNTRNVFINTKGIDTFTKTGVQGLLEMHLDTAYPPTGGAGIHLRDNLYLGVGLVSGTPTAAVAYRGKMIRVEGTSGIGDITYICQKTSSNTYSWQTIAV